MNRTGAVVPANWGFVSKFLGHVTCTPGDMTMFVLVQIMIYSFVGDV